MTAGSGPRFGIVATLDVRDGEQAGFEAHMRAFRQLVLEHEPGVLVFEVMRERGSDTRYIVMELFIDEAAALAHREYDHFKRMRPGIDAFLVAPRPAPRYLAIPDGAATEPDS